MMDVMVLPRKLQEIEEGLGDWETVPQCVRETLLAILGSSNPNASNAMMDEAKRTLLPLRQKGPKTDITSTINAILESHRSPVISAANPPYIATNLDEVLTRHHQVPSVPAVTAVSPPRSYNGHNFSNDNDDGDRNEEEGGEKLEAEGSRIPRVREPLLLPEKRVYYGSVPEAPSELSRRDRQSSSRRTGKVSQKKRSLQVRPIAMEMPTVKKVECVQHRREVTDALLRVHGEIDRLQAEADSFLVKAIYDSMRLDLRRAKDVYGEVKPLPHPTEEQEQALAAFAEGLAVLQEATVELVSAFLSQEEKRFLGVSTHKYQTRAQRSTTYQYVSSSEKKRKEQGTVKRAHGDISFTSEDKKENMNRNEDSPRRVSQGPAVSGNAITRPSSTTMTSAVPPAAAGDITAVTEKRGVAGSKPSQKARAKAKPHPKPSQQSFADPKLSAAVAAAPEPQAMGGQPRLKMLPQLDKLGLSSAPVAAAAAAEPTVTAPTIAPQRTEKGDTFSSAPPLKKQGSCSTLSTKSSDSAGNRVHVKKEAVTQEAAKPAAPAPAAAPPAKKTVGLGKIDIRRFLIDSDSDSSAV
ncbi:hypothetical protein C3747_95g49 [Trypanosoma cruzi]|uniref:Uncharacterized protein n=2 Tax=Trypanosoma cruzi TaxID=5693 RepID=Q4D0D2_TRYCC|nr:hypothetical protein, conserved [Trypanosoma cruzi]EAN85985.1 hypothetical protein, conserved [Trypanosoma cruzi]PWV08003.1 hypothetical protein C3747_95g49 [Trypanosoma cruzi]|eukprot:XP_807836.1 hypothetical protein [Trypanosoma cruzi strain CL Brener]